MLTKQWETDIGDTVLCDYCNEDFTDEPNSLMTGGILVGSNAIYPHCQPEAMENLKKYNEEDHLIDCAAAGETFKDFVLRIRNGNNSVAFFAGE